WGVGLCTSEDDMAAMLRSIVGRSRLCVVRDEMTRQFLGMGEIAPCPSIFAMRSMTTRSSDAQGLLHAAHYDLVAPAHYEAIKAVVKEFARRSDRSYRETDNRTP